MANPFGSLKYLPWSSLFQSAAVTIAIATLLDYGIYWGLDTWAQTQPNATVRAVLGTIFFMRLAVAYGIGALSLLITERFFREVVLTAKTLWALIGCVVLLYWLRTLFSSTVPGLLMSLDLYNMTLIALGAFFTGKRHWR